MHHMLANSSTGCKAVDCGRKNGVSGQPNAVASRRVVPTNEIAILVPKDCFLGTRLGIGGPDPTVGGIPVGISERVSV